MPQKTKHHYVPKFHLRNFSIDQNGTHLKVCRKSPFLVIPEGVLKNQGYVKNFYGKTDEYENYLSNFEGVVSKEIKTLFETEILPKKSSLEYLNLLFLTLLQNSRTRAAAKTVDKLTDSTIQSFMEGDERFKKLAEDQKFKMKEPVFLTLATLKQSLKVTSDLECKLLINDRKIPFITSDCPVAMYNQFLERRKHPGGHLGLKTKGLQIIFPLNPKYALIFFDTRIYNVGYRKRSTVTTSLSSDIDAINLLQFLTADEVVFSNEQVSDHYFKKLKDRASKTPWNKEFINGEIQKTHRMDGTISETHHSYIANPSFNLNLSFIRETSIAKNFKPSGYFVEIRNDNRPK